MKREIHCADAIAKHIGRFVVVERLSSLKGLAFPGGKIDPGETAEEAVIREMREETGLIFSIEGKLGLYNAPGRDPRGEYSSTVFYGTASGEPKEESGKTHVLFLTREELLARRREFVSDHAQMFDDFERK